MLATVKPGYFFYLLSFALLVITAFITITNKTYLLQHQFMTPKQCSCKRCVSELGVSEWFDKRYVSNMMPFLTKSNKTIPLVAYNWWKRLQGGANQPNISTVLEELFEVFPGDSLLMDAGPKRCRTCAVVGNSGNLIGSKYGPSIDSHNLVMRMNHAKTVGYEADVGSKTSHQFMYPESAQNLAENVSLVLIPFKILDLRWLISAFTTGRITRTYTRVLNKIKADRDKVLVVNPHFFKYIHNNWTENHGRYSSTGMITLIFALHVCDEVDVYGFGANKLGHWHHYWEKNPGAGAFRITKIHDGDFEANVIQTLANISKIQFFKGA
ncbi:CMP-N-acetylneuraminate-beta-galactosamide-alpha-2,3-sialyltransferase 1-like [Hypanus sabinus]|uniref:CMP-N-acetylneuraminate-beta-galactosamide- alpha-2,3-sialyltransferase 1-like n=1 Tax=Hypanus sabinus TaxID=79690 RepID=UPI0028C3B684|nr:CMP-N-acetylneuraminate-beta-galactosamide-alpha-2,3-sialyltransferase 1-like [Hypanus sabinus]XP_059831066.1 CMP-N-acetylneuraminate-beta-galactosamide-alpha-2,3-sialyltransferase 1-like [Hypanus sabinus]